MPNAIYIVGNWEGFLLQGVVRMKTYLEGIGIRTGAFIEAKRFNPERFKESLRAAVSRIENKKEPLLVFYSGHGAKNGWQVGTFEGDEEDENYGIFPYKELAKVFASYPGPILLMNDCCYSFAAAACLRRRPRLASRTGVIASSAASKESRGSSLAQEIIDSWNAGKRFTTRVRARSPFIKVGRKMRKIGVEVVAFTDVFADVAVIKENVAEGKQPGAANIEVADGGLVDSFKNDDWINDWLVEDWKLRRGYKRWGKMLDHYFFPTIGAREAVRQQR